MIIGTTDFYYVNQALFRISSLCPCLSLLISELNRALYFQSSFTFRNSMASTLESTTHELSKLGINGDFASSAPNLQKNLHLLSPEQVDITMAT